MHSSALCIRVAQYQFFLIDSISIILFPFLSIPISISINLKRAYQYQYVINYWKIPLSISISISINLLPYQYRYQYFSSCLKSSYYKSPTAQIVRQQLGPQVRVKLSLYFFSKGVIVFFVRLK